MGGCIGVGGWWSAGAPSQMSRGKGWGKEILEGARKGRAFGMQINRTIKKLKL